MNFYGETKTEKQCLEDTRKAYLKKLEELEDEEIKIVNIIASCNEQLLAMEEEVPQDGAVVSSGVS